LNAYDALGLYIEVAIGIAGFSGIIAAIKHSEIGSWEIGDQISFEVVLTASITAMLFAFVPILLSLAHVRETDVWKYASSIAVAFLLIGITRRFIQVRRGNGSTNELARVLISGVVTIVLVLANTFLGYPWIYMLFLLLLTLFSLVSFVTIISKIIRSG